MKFTKPINREVDIEGHTFIVSFDDMGIEFRVKGKRKSANVAWSRVLEIAEGEDGASASQFLGLGASNTQSEQAERQEYTSAPQTPRDDQFQETGSPQLQESSTAAPQAGEPFDTDQETGRAVSAGEKGPES
ncbi:MAG TPA: hypothetical protein VJZ26_17055 [Blastocatellia bacterium]|nr:hypothetical protein [Blastocatellia bacterium]